jgi:hypothetical protein
MRKVALLGTLVVLLIAVPAVMAKTSSAGSACSGNKNVSYTYNVFGG